MIMHISHIIHEEQRPFSYRDFIRFEIDGQEFRMTHGTFRNNVSCLMKEGLVEVSYKSSITFYTLRGVKFSKDSRIVMTHDHTGVVSSSVSVSPISPLSLSSNPLYRIIRDLPLDKNSVHDIRLKFASPQIYAITSSSISSKVGGHEYTVNSKSLDILLPAWKLRGLLVKATVHRTDIVSIVVGCSLNPVSLDVSGIIRLTNALSVVEDRLSRLVGGAHMISIIPKYSEWTVTMWHFGADSSVEYSGERFCVAWETAENVLLRAYSKMTNDNRRTRIRLERQEYPKATLADLIEQKINQNQRYEG
jgi:hypothetical protein